MIVELEVSPDYDADDCGEILMLSLNRKQRWSYTTDICAEEWVYLEEKPSLTVLTLLKGFLAKEEGDKYVEKLVSTKTGAKVFSYCDGDTTVAFEVEGNLLVNNDAKKSYGWEWNPSWVNDLPKDYYWNGKEEILW